MEMIKMLHVPQNFTEINIDIPSLIIIEFTYYFCEHQFVVVVLNDHK